MRYFLIIPILMLAACEEKPIEQMGYAERVALVDQIIARCEALGIKRDSPEMTVCGDAEIEKEVTTRQANRNRRLEAAAALSEVGQQGVTCTTQQFGTMTRTRCN